MYRVEEEDDTFLIREISSDLVIHKTISRKEANDICRNLNLGGGFDGHTPVFFKR